MPVQRIEKQIEREPFGRGLRKFGNIRKGFRNPETGAMGDLTYFRTTFYEQPDGSHDLLMGEFDALYGSQPAIFHNVFVVGDTAAQAFNYWMQEHTKTKLVHQCDEETQFKHFDAAAGRTVDTPIACARANGGQCGCKMVAWFDIILPDFCRQVGRVGYFTVHTQSEYDIWALRKWFRDIETLHQGSVSGIPLVLGRAPREVRIRYQDKNGQWQLKLDTKHLLFLEPSQGYVHNVLMPGYTARPYALESGKIDTDGMIIESPNTAQAKFEQSFNQLDALPATVETDEEFVSSQHPARLWDEDRVKERTSPQFDHPTHQDNTLAKMIADGELTDDMTTEQAVIAVLENRRRRTAEKVAAADAGENHWTSDPKAVAGLVAGANDKFGMNTGEVIAALNYSLPDELTLDSIEQFPGSKDEAWAACLAFNYSYSPDKIRAALREPDKASLLKLALDICQSDRIPF